MSTPFARLSVPVEDREVEHDDGRLDEHDLDNHTFYASLGNGGYIRRPLPAHE